MVGGVCAWREHLNNIVISMKPNVCDTPLSIYNKMMFLQLHEESRVKGGGLRDGQLRGAQPVKERAIYTRRCSE